MNDFDKSFIIGINKNGIPILCSRKQISEKLKLRRLNKEVARKQKIIEKSKDSPPSKVLLDKMHRAVPGSANDPCVYCGGAVENVDHIVPRSQGGHVKLLYNLAPTCRACNTAKGSKSVLLFLLGRNR